ncbi:MAG: ATP-binding protein [Nitrososphaerales archaeon]
MQVLTKDADEVYLLYSTREEVEVGENIKIWDSNKKRGVIVQVIELNLADMPGMMEDLTRNESIEPGKIKEYVPKGLKQFVSDIRNMKLAMGKIRKEIVTEDQSVIPWSGWMPDRGAIVEPSEDSWLISKLEVGNPFPIHMGETIYGKAPFHVSAFDIQEGGTTVITGKKGTGKSHAAKMLLLGFIKHGARCIVFDVNDEYSGLDQTLQDEKIPGKIIKLEPGSNLKFLAPYIGVDIIAKMLRSQMGAGGPSVYDFERTWYRLLRNKSPITLDTLIGALQPVEDDTTQQNVSRVTAGAIIRRLRSLQRTRLFTDRPDAAVTLENELKKLGEGGALVFNLKGKRGDIRNIVVGTILSKLESLLDSDKSYPPIFIFAEEAHLYIEGTDWDNIVTRMRHLGTYQFYITNTPTSLPDMLIRQTDNLFLFNLMNDEDYSFIAPAAHLDTTTIRHVAKALPPRTCMAIGSATKDFPFVIATANLNYAAGESRRFFMYDGNTESKASFSESDSKVVAPKSENEDFSL